MWCIKRVYCEQLVGFFIFPSKFGNPEVEEKLFYRFISFLFIMKISQCKEMITHILLLRSTIRQCKLTYCFVYCMMSYSASAFSILDLLSTITNYKFSYQFLQLQSSSSIYRLYGPVLKSPSDEEHNFYLITCGWLLKKCYLFCDNDNWIL